MSFQEIIKLSVKKKKFNKKNAAIFSWLFIVWVFIKLFGYKFMQKKLLNAKNCVNEKFFY